MKKSITFDKFRIRNGSFDAGVLFAAVGRGLWVGCGEKQRRNLGKITVCESALLTQCKKFQKRRLHIVFMWVCDIINSINKSIVYMVKKSVKSGIYPKCEENLINILLIYQNIGTGENQKTLTYYFNVGIC